MSPAVPPSRRPRRLVPLLASGLLLSSAIALGPSASDEHSRPAGAMVAATVAPAAGAALKDRWVTRSGSRLLLAGKPWRFTGVNVYWLGLDENQPDRYGATYPRRAVVDQAMAAAIRVGAKLVRSTTLGVSVGSPRSLEPRPGVFNNRAFAAIDYAVWSARRHGLRLMIPLTDQWHYYHGGKHTFTNWFGPRDLPGHNSVTSPAQRAREATFYTSPRVIAGFRAYVRHLLLHRNPLTGTRLADDPTIAIWETGNELWDAPPSWTASTASYIKSLAPRALVADGSAASGKNIRETGFAGRHVDIVDGHFYPRHTTKAVSDARFVRSRGKAYVVGEYPLTGTGVYPFLSALAREPAVAGGLAWSLLPRLPDGTPVPHHDGYTFHSPSASWSEHLMVVAQIWYARRVARG